MSESDLGMYELEDMIWDDVYQSDDHIVPHRGDGRADQRSFGSDTRKRTSRESTLEDDAGGSSFEKNICRDKTEQLKHTVHNKHRMLEKEACSNEADNVFCSASSKSITEALSLASDGMNTSDDTFMDTLPSGGELSCKESILSEKTFVLGHSVGYQHRFPETYNNASFIDNRGGKDSNDLSCYSWDDLGNFEDVDRMFRSSDSTFGLGTSQEDELDWLSSSDNVLKSDVNFSCPDPSSQRSTSEGEDTSRSNGMTCSINESALFDGSGQLGILSFSSGTGSGSTDIKDKVIPNVQIDQPIKQMKFPNQPEYHKNDQYVGNSSLLNAADVQDSFSYLHSDTTFMSSDFSIPSDQSSLHPAPSAIKSEYGRPTCVIPKESYSLNQMQVIDSDESSPQVISFAVGNKGDWMNQPKKCRASSNGVPKNIAFGAQTSKSASISNEKPIHYSGISHMNGLNKGIRQELGSSVSQGSSISSGLDDISIEATSFRQLQVVMEQLDPRTKLCIRDSLYRLARSAEQRHQYVKLNGGPPGDRDSMLAGGCTKFPDFIDMETDTNPIDRSIAHLLFHRPADSPVLAGRDGPSFNSPTPRLIHGPVHSSPVVRDVKHEETAADHN